MAMTTPATGTESENADGQSPPKITPKEVIPFVRPAEAEIEDDRLPSRPLQWMLLMGAAAIVGTAAGVVGATFRMVLNWEDDFRYSMIIWAHVHGYHWLMWAIPCSICALGAGLACWLTQTFAPSTAGSGIPRVEAVLRSHLRPATAHILPVKFFGGALSIGSGLAMGREGPTVQMGGTIGRIFSDILGRFLAEPWTLMAAGAGAGLAVAFNAPLAACLFVVEELLHRFSSRVFCATLISCICGTVMLRMMLGNTPDFGSPVLGAWSAEVLPEYLVLGALAGLVGVAFNVSLLGTLQLFDRASHWPRGAKGAIVGGVVGLIAWFSPAAVGGGDNLAQLAITEHRALLAILSMLFIRFALTMGSYGSGAPGGIFAPLLAIGALLGNGFALINSDLRHLPFDPSAFAIVSMAACFTAIVRSPLTGVVLLLEMTGSWTLILPMMAASVTAYAIPELLRNPPIYDSLRERDEMMERMGQKPTL
jgi:CIC family chloride channel protein